MQRSGSGLIQAVEWRPGMPVNTGTFNKVVLLHCVADGEVTAHFKTGDETRTFKAGDDVTLPYVDVTISSGSFDVN